MTVTVQMRKNVHTIRADKVVSLRNGRLDRKSSELHISRNGKEGQTYLSEKSMIQCLDVKVVCSADGKDKSKETEDEEKEQWGEGGRTRTALGCACAQSRL